jgi:hypothetical protein
LTVDLSRFDSVRNFAVRLDAAVPYLHVAVPAYILGAEGNEMALEVDALAAALLTLLLLPKLCATAVTLPDDTAGFCHLSPVNSVAHLEVKLEDIPPEQSLIQRINDRDQFDFTKQFSRQARCLVCRSSQYSMTFTSTFGPFRNNSSHAT